jgi:nicotinamidase-related amidase
LSRFPEPGRRRQRHHDGDHPLPRRPAPRRDRQLGGPAELAPPADIVTELAPASGDTVLTKTSMDTFVSTHLAEELDRLGVRTLVIGGVLTDACVESSARQAAERGIQVFVAEDAFHAASLANLSRYFARVVSTSQIIRKLESGRRLSCPRLHVSIGGDERA